MREPAGQNDDVGAAKAGVLVPHELGVLPEDVRRGVVRIVIAVGTRKDNDSKFHISIR